MKQSTTPDSPACWSSSGRSKMDMSIPIPSMLFGMGGKCVLNWGLVFFQKNHILRSFLCVFSLSVSIVDTIVTLFVTFIHLLQDSNFLGWRMTRYHVCLLVQILGYIYSAQHFFILVLAFLEHLYVVLRSQNVTWKPTWIFHLFLTIIVWLCSTLYVFKFSNMYLFLEDAAHFQFDNCWVSSSSVISEVACFVFFLLICFIMWHSLNHGVQYAKNPNYFITIKPQIHTRLIFILKVVYSIFLGTWLLFLTFLLLGVVLMVQMPSYLGLNCAWFCFLNSLLIALVLCIVYPSFELAQGLAAVPPDSFCEWKRRFRSTIVIT